MSRPTPFLALAATLALCAAATPARAFTDLLGGKRATFVDKANPKLDSAKLTFAKDPGLFSTQSPLCPTASSIRLLKDGKTYPEIPLDCAKWRITGSSFRYSSKTGPVRSITYGPGKLNVRIQGPPYSDDPMRGPATFVEARFRVGALDHCGRFQIFASNANGPSRVVAKGPTVACQIACGNAIVEEDETCDDGNATSGDGCDANCTPTACGNGVVTTGEICDDGNAAGGDGCRADCTPEACGDAIVDPQESCDDGNAASGDCCSATCGVEPAGSPCADDANGCTDDLCDGAGACAHALNTAPCDDANDCTLNDVCAGGVCGGDRIAPWVNEFDYDDFERGGNDDSQEMVEIAGPAGTDLGGYKILSIEGNASGLGLTCISGSGTLEGNAYFQATIPAGAVLQDDTGTGIGFYVVCFTGTSAGYASAGQCDVVLPAPFGDSNLMNGHVLNSDEFTCPDGLLVLDPQGGLVDAITWEGIIPSVGPYGPLFHVTPYRAPRDEGLRSKVSIEKTTSALGRATSASEWRDSGGCTDQNAGLPPLIPPGDPCPPNTSTPGVENPLQTLQCFVPPCGDGQLGPDEECDDGDDNSDAPDATCRTDCTLQRCGDGVVDPSASPGWPEQCESDADCGGGQSCFACRCSSGTPLGAVSFTVVPGPSALQNTDDGQSSWLRVSPILLDINNGSNGQFTPGPLVLAAGAPDASGVAPLVLAAPATIAAPLPDLAGGGAVCFRLSQDTENLGAIDCNGGSSFGVAMTVDSNGAGANGVAVLAVGDGADAGAGAAVVRVVLEAGQAASVAGCADATWADPIRTALTTATASATISNALQGGSTTVTLTGQPLDCGAWVPDTGASLAMPNLNLDLFIAPANATFDVAQVLRLNDD